jgi:ribosomal protein L32
MTLANSLGLPVHPRRKRRHGERHVIAAEADRCCSCGQAIRKHPIDAWGQIKAALAAATEPLTMGEIRAATGLQTANASAALVHHAHELDRTGERGGYRYSLRRSA